MDKIIIEQIDKLRKEVKRLGGLDPESKQNYEKKIRLEFNYNTNHLEGNTLTYSETELLLMFDDTKGNHTLREYEEMKGSDVALKLIAEWAEDSERVLSEQWIKTLNQVLLVRPYWKEAVSLDGQQTRREILVGDYKQHPNSVRLVNGELFHYASPTDTPILMGELIDWYREEEKKGEMHPVDLAAHLHYKFVRIHPFDDGNGRVSRLLMNYVLLRNGFPPVVIKSSDKRNYLQALNEADAGKMEVFCDYIGNQLIWSLNLSLKAAKKESLDEPGDLDKKIKLLKQKLNIDKAVTINKSKDILLKVLTSELEPVFKGLSAKLGEFDILFKSKSDELTSEGASWGSTLERSLNKIKEHFKVNQINSLVYFYRLNDFRKGKQMNVVCYFSISFHMNVYEITSDLAKFKISKLYDEPILEDERSQIIEELGTYVLEQIEKAL